MKGVEDEKLAKEVKFKLDKRKGRRVASPGHQEVRAGESVRFRALGAKCMTLLFPVAIFEKDGRDVERIDLSDREDSKWSDNETLRVKEDIDPGTYPYAAFCHDMFDFAEGGSHPKVIVRR